MEMTVIKPVKFVSSLKLETKFKLHLKKLNLVLFHQAVQKNLVLIETEMTIYSYTVLPY